MHQHNTPHPCHGHGKNASLKTLLYAIALVLIFAIIEALGGWWSGSLALISDAGHMASDAIALSIAAFAAWIAQKPASSKHSYGYGRAEVIAAWFSSLLLFALSIVVIVEAISRLHHPTPVEGHVVAVIAFVGLLINLLVAWLLLRSEQTINIRAALLHVFGDVLGSFAALLSGIIISVYGWLLIDPILSLLISALIMISSVTLLRESMHILMEGVPTHINQTAVNETLLSITDVKDTHDLHIWTLSSGRIALSAHIQLEQLEDWPNVLESIKCALEKNYQITHVTLQPELDMASCDPCNAKEPHCEKKHTPH